MKLKTVFHQDGKRYAEIHTDQKSDKLEVRTFDGAGRQLSSMDYEVVSAQEVIDEVNIWASI